MCEVQCAHVLRCARVLLRVDGGLFALRFDVGSYVVPSVVCRNRFSVKTRFEQTFRTTTARPDTCAGISRALLFMEIHQIRYMCAVAETGSFTRAAAREHISQPSLSQQIIKLERELGTKLFYRFSRSVRLTESGQVFLPMHFPEVNRLTFPAYDPHSRQPSYKACAVAVAARPG